MRPKLPPETLKNNTITLFILCLLLTVWTVVIYWQVLSFDFIEYDDAKYVTNNYHIQTGFTPSAIRWAFTTLHAGFWQPLVWLSFMLDFQLYGLNPAVFHATNLAFHVFNTALLFLFLHLATKTMWRSWFVAFFFALHPLHVESVAWIAERKDVLSTFFFMLILLSYYWYTQKPSLQRYLLIIVLFILGLSSKAMLVSVPFLLLLLDYWPTGRYGLASVNNTSKREDFRTAFDLMKEKIPLLFVAMIFSIITIFTQKTGGAVVSQAIHPIDLRITNAVTSYVIYIRKMFFPYDLAVLYPFPSSISTAKVLSAAFLLLAITWFIIKMRKTRPYTTLGWFWYTASIFPVIGLIQVGPQAMADRFTYIPLIGLFIICVWGFYEITTLLSIKKTFLAISAILVILFYSTLTWKQISYWKDPLTLFTHTLSVTENNYVAHTILGTSFSEQGEIKKAADHFLTALEIAPGYKSAHVGYGITLAKMQRMQEAESHFREALNIDPHSATVHFNLGLALYKRQIIDEAAYHFTQVLQQHPDHPKAHFYLANILAEQGKMTEAISHYKIALSILPDDHRIQKNLKRAEAILRKVD
jgi:tetratricopeptide (TPR) repeat protein